MTRAREYLIRMSILMTSLEWHGAFSFSRCWEKIIKVYTYITIDVIRVKNENCEFLQNLCTDFLGALSVKTPWVFTLFP